MIMNPEGLLSAETKPNGIPALCLDYPLRPQFLAQLVVPRDMNTAEAKRLCAFIETLVTKRGNEQ